jgi:hypothetical protein
MKTSCLNKLQKKKGKRKVMRVEERKEERKERGKERQREEKKQERKEERRVAIKGRESREELLRVSSGRIRKPYFIS